jgi:hypothetical protein
MSSAFSSVSRLYRLAALSHDLPASRLAVLLPAATVLNVVLHSYVDHAIPTHAIWRPLFVGMAAAGAFAAVTSILAGVPRGPVLTTVALAVLLIHGNGLLVTSLAVLALLGLLFLERTRRIEWSSMAKALLVFSGILLILGIGRVASVADRIAADIRGLPTHELRDSGRDVFVILLDGYPRADTLAQTFDFDNRPFLHELHALGFDVYSDSRSNYPSTTLSVASALQGSELAGVPTSQPELRYQAWDSPMVRIARSRGYEFVAISSGWDELSVRRADVFIDSGAIGQFEQSLVERNALGWVIALLSPDFFGDQRRKRIDDILGAISELAAKPHRAPRFVWAHVPAPHYPSVYSGETPRRVELADFRGYATSGGELVREYVQNLRGLNDRVLAILRNPAMDDAIVVIWSDHGSLTRLGPPEERVRNFLAARTPGRPMLFGHEPSPWQLLPRLWNSYLGTHLPVIPSRSYAFGRSRDELLQIEP